MIFICNGSVRLIKYYTQKQYNWSKLLNENNIYKQTLQKLTEALSIYCMYI